MAFGGQRPYCETKDLTTGVVLLFYQSDVQGSIADYSLINSPKLGLLARHVNGVKCWP